MGAGRARHLGATEKRSPPSISLFSRTERRARPDLPVQGRSHPTAVPGLADAVSSRLSAFSPSAPPVRGDVASGTHTGPSNFSPLSLPLPLGIPASSPSHPLPLPLMPDLASCPAPLPPLPLWSKAGGVGWGACFRANLDLLGTRVRTAPGEGVARPVDTALPGGVLETGTGRGLSQQSGRGKVVNGQTDRQTTVISWSDR